MKPTPHEGLNKLSYEVSRVVLENLRHAKTTDEAFLMMFGTATHFINATRDVMCKADPLVAELRIDAQLSVLMSMIAQYIVEPEGVYLPKELPSVEEQAYRKMLIKRLWDFLEKVP